VHPNARRGWLLDPPGIGMRGLPDFHSRWLANAGCCAAGFERFLKPVPAALQKF